MLPNFDVLTIVPLENNVLVGTNYGPLFLDNDDFERFNFDLDWLIDNIDTDEALELLSQIKLYYMEQAMKLYREGELS